ncbi:MAG: putative permease, superfamily [Betaproteobacteria bacterium]|nr:putative permease, superfamily [Betaproteobacteria bacterium]
MLLASFLLAIVGITIKYAAAAGYSTGEIVFYRTFIGFAVVSVMMALRGVSPRSAHTLGHVQRGAAGTFAMWLFIYAVVHLPLSTAITLNFTAPLWIALILALVFGERLSKTMLAALGLGFLGIAILLKPIFSPEMRFDITIGLLSGIAGAVALLNVRRLGALGEPEMRIFWWSSMIISGGAALWLTASGGWRWHGSNGLAWIAALGALATGAQLAQTRAFSRGAAILAANLSYSTVLFSAIADLLLWNIHIAASGWLAIAIIISSGIMATLRTRKSARREAAAAAPAEPIEPEPPSTDP